MRRLALPLALVLGLLSLPACAQDVGVFVRPGTGSVGSPVAKETYLFDTNDLNLKVYNAASAWEARTMPHFNLNGGGIPTIFNDNTQGYLPGSVWYDATGKNLYACSDGSTGAAVWSQYSNGISSNTLGLKFTTGDWINDFVATGLVGTVPGSGYTMTTPGGIAYVSGLRITPGSSAYSYPANSDVYDYLQQNGTINHPAVINNATPPSGQPGLFIQKVVTNGSGIATVTQTQATTPGINVRALQLTIVDSGGKNAYIISPATPSALRTYGLPDAGGSAKFGMQANGDTYTSGGVLYGTGATHATTVAGTNPQVLTSNGASAPSWQNLPPSARFGGDGSLGAFSGNNGANRSPQQNWTTYEITSGPAWAVESGTVINCTSTFKVDSGGVLNPTPFFVGGICLSDNSIEAPGGDCPAYRTLKATGAAGNPGGNGGGAYGHGGPGGYSPYVHGSAGVFDVFAIQGLRPGSGGGGGWVSGTTQTTSLGGTGGGTLRVCAAGAVTISGPINLPGSAGQNATDVNAGGAGGGAGGSAAIYSSTSVTCSGGSVNCNGGDGGGSTNGGGGGGGAGGSILVQAPTITSFSGSVNNGSGALGGSGGGGTSGQSGTLVQLTGVPNFPLVTMHEKHWGLMMQLANVQQNVRAVPFVEWTNRDNISFLAATQAHSKEEFENICYTLNNSDMERADAVCELFVGDFINEADAA